MIRSQDITQQRQQEAAVALGFFDGVHLGHRAVIGAAIEEGRKRGLASRVFTFDPAGDKPASKNALTLLQTEEQKDRVLEAMGADEVVCPPFSSFKNLSPEDFFHHLLMDTLRARVLTCGENYRFGHFAAAGVDQLREMCRQAGVQLVVVPPVTLDGEMISSTRIRQALRDGDVELANRMLGAPFTLEAPVVHGKQWGRTVSCPTINQLFPEGFTVPRYGVYAAEVMVDGRRYRGVTNIGVKPTMQDNYLTCETYLLDFSGDLYEKTVGVSLIHFLRPETRFSSAAELSEQIHKDIRQVEQALPAGC